MVLSGMTDRLCESVRKADNAKNEMYEKIKYNHLTYKHYDDYDKEAREEYFNQLAEIFKGIEDILPELKEVKAKVESVLVKPIPENLKVLIEEFSQMGDLNENDIDILLRNSEHSYVGRRVVESKFNLRKKVESEYNEVIDYLDYLYSAIHDNIVRPLKIWEAPNIDSYKLRVLIHKEKTDEYVKTINDFVDRFVDEN